MIGLRTPRLREIAVLGAHCSDIATGMGGTLLSLMSGQGTRPRVHALVLSGGTTHHEVEERRALAALCGDAELDLRVLTFPEGRVFGYRGDISSALEDFRYRCEPDAVFAPRRGDTHDDRGQAAELVHEAFRDHFVLGYEVELQSSPATPRGGTAPAIVFHPLTRAEADEKARILVDHYRSRDAHHFPDEQAFLGLLRLRGTQCRRPYAEAFVTEKTVAYFDGRTSPPEFGRAQ